MKRTFYTKYGKRVFDIIASFTLIILFSPLLILIYFLVLIKLGKPVIFRQYRPGLNGKIYMMLKFRTMTNDYNEAGKLLSDESRMTKFGAFLRSTSFDELPELFNVLTGKMSLVGPRPQLIEDMLFMSDEIKMRHIVAPGITGLAQINGRNGISWDEKFIYDLNYIDNISFFLDLKILLLTLSTVIRKQGLNSEGKVTGENYGEYLKRKGSITNDEFDDTMNFVSRFIEKNINIKGNKKDMKW